MFCCVSPGEEVALYCSKYLPDIIKEQKAYKDGKLQKVTLAAPHTVVCARLIMTKISRDCCDPQLCGILVEFMCVNMIDLN